MDFNSFDTKTQLQLILKDLSSCHALGVDALKFGSALKALEIVIANMNEEGEDNEE